MCSEVNWLHTTTTHMVDYSLQPTQSKNISANYPDLKRSMKENGYGSINCNLHIGEKGGRISIHKSNSSIFNNFLNLYFPTFAFRETMKVKCKRHTRCVFILLFHPPYAASRKELHCPLTKALFWVDVVQLSASTWLPMKEANKTIYSYKRNLNKTENRIKYWETTRSVYKNSLFDCILYMFCI